MRFSHPYRLLSLILVTAMLLSACAGVAPSAPAGGQPAADGGKVQVKLATWAAEETGRHVSENSCWILQGLVSPTLQSCYLSLSGRQLELFLHASP